jgi:hypothetical protein
MNTNNGVKRKIISVEVKQQRRKQEQLFWVGLSED